MAPGTSLAASSLAKFEPSLLLSTIIKSYLLLWGFKVALPDSHFLHSFIWKRNAIVVVQVDFSEWDCCVLMIVGSSLGCTFFPACLLQSKICCVVGLVRALGK